MNPPVSPLWVHPGGSDIWKKHCQKSPCSFEPFVSESLYFLPQGGNLFILNIRTVPGYEHHCHNPLGGMSESWQNHLGCLWGRIYSQKGVGGGKLISPEIKYFMKPSNHVIKRFCWLTVQIQMSYFSRLILGWKNILYLITPSSDFFMCARWVSSLVPT